MTSGLLGTKLRAISIGAGVATAAASGLLLGSPAQAATSSVHFNAASNGLAAPMDLGPLGTGISSATGLQCNPTNGCSVSSSGPLFAGVTNYGPLSFNYNTDAGTGSVSSFTKGFTGNLSSFSLLGGSSPITVALNGPFSGTFVGDVPQTGETKNYTPSTVSVPATVTIGSTTYSTASVLFTAYSNFNWGSNDNIFSASNLWVYAEDQEVPPTQAPSPLPILGASAAFGWTRKLRGRIRKAA